MTVELRWEGILAGLEDEGWHASVVPASRAGDLEAVINRAVDDYEVPPEFRESIQRYLRVSFPEEMPRPRSMLIGAIARPLTQAALVWKGRRHVVQIAPHYRGYYQATPQFAEAASVALRAWGFDAAPFYPPLKTLATHSGLARYGRNNITYVAGLGSYLALAACVSDAPPPTQDPWQEAVALERCEGCKACRRACPTGAIAGDRFLLHAERCLTYFNEDEAPFPDWIRLEWHKFAVGCMRCQEVCPENKGALVVEPAVEFDAGETESILAGADPATLTQGTRDKMALCGLDYSSTFMPRNVRLLLDA